MSVNLLDQLPASETTQITRARRRVTFVLWLIWLGIQIATCLGIDPLFRLAAEDNWSQLSVCGVLGIVLAFPVACGMMMVFFGFSLGIRLVAGLTAISIWAITLWLGTNIASEIAPEVTGVWPAFGNGREIFLSIPSALLGIIIPALIFQTALGWRVVFPIWELNRRRPSWSIRGVALITLGIAISIWAAQFAPRNSGSFLLTALMASGITSALLPILALILKSRHYFRWFFVVEFLLLCLPILIFELLIGFPWLDGFPIGVFISCFAGFALLPFLISRSGGGLLWEAQKAALKVDKTHEKMT